MGTRSQNAAQAGTINDLGVTSSEVHAIVDGKDTLGLMKPEVQGLVDVGVNFARQRPNGQGVAPAGASILTTGEDVETAINALRTQLINLSGSAPQNTGQPGAPTGTALVDSLLTATGINGTWSMPIASYTRRWYRIKNGQSPVDTGAVGDTYRTQPADYGFQMADAVVAIPVVGVPSQPVLSALTAVIDTPVVGTTTAPSFNVSGNQASGLTVTWNRGAYTNFGKCTVLLKSGGSVFATIPNVTAATGTFDLVDTQIGQNITIGVIPFNAVGVSFPEVAGSNSINVTGAAPAFQLVSPPVLPPLVLEQGATVTEPAFNLTPDASPPIIHNFYKNGLSSAFRSGNYGPTFTPHKAPHPDALVAGDQVKMGAVATYLGVTQNEVFSNTVTVTDPTADLVVTSAVSGTLDWTQGQSIGQLVLGTISGGEAPYVLVNTAPAQAGVTVAISGSQIVASGSPAALSNATIYTVNVRDSAAVQDTAAMTFTASVSPASGVQPIPVVLLSRQSGIVVTNGPSGVYNGVDNIVGNDGILRMGPIIDPNGSGRQVDFFRVVNGAGNQRSEILFDDGGVPLVPGRRYGVAMAFMLLPAEYPSPSGFDDSFLVLQSHTPMSGDTQPDYMVNIDRQAGRMRIIVSGQPTLPFNGPNWETTSIPSTTLYSGPVPAPGVWISLYVEWQVGWTASQGPSVTTWGKRGTGAWSQLHAAYTGVNTYNSNGLSYLYSYLRNGFYKFSPFNDPRLGMCMTRYYVMEGSNLLARGQQSLIGLN